LEQSLALARDQYGDAQKRRAAGAVGELEELAAHQDVLRRSRELAQARADLASASRDFQALTGLAPEPPGPELETQEESLAGLDFAAAAELDRSHPALLERTELAESLRQAARSSWAGRRPRILLSARSSFDYPNGAALETVLQNSVGLSASLPLFDFGRSSGEAADRESQALAQESLRAQAKTDLERDWLKAKDQVEGLRSQRGFAAAAVEETAALAKGKYESYKHGRASMLELRSANLEALEARLQSARVDAELLERLAVLASLGKPKLSN
jgi:outer membrane protein